MPASSNDFTKLVIARIQSMPDGTQISIGNGKNLSKAEVLKAVEEGSDVGKQMIEVERAFFQALKDGSFSKDAEQ